MEKVEKTEIVIKKLYLVWEAEGKSLGSTPLHFCLPGISASMVLYHRASEEKKGSKDVVNKY